MYKGLFMVCIVLVPPANNNKKSKISMHNSAHAENFVARDGYSLYKPKRVIAAAITKNIAKSQV